MIIVIVGYENQVGRWASHFPRVKVDNSATFHSETGMAQPNYEISLSDCYEFILLTKIVYFLFKRL